MENKCKEYLQRCKSKKVLLSVAGFALTLVLAAVVLPRITAQADDTALPTYKETAVTRGDLTVGMTESGTAAIGSESVSYPYTAEVEEVLVKAGQKVQAGDALMRVATDAIEDALSEATLKYNEAKLAYDKAVLNQKEKGAEAQLTYDTNAAKGSTASTTADNTVTGLLNAKNTARAAYEDAVAQRDAAQALIDAGPASLEGLAADSAEYAAAEAQNTAYNEAVASIEQKNKTVNEKYTAADKADNDYATGAAAAAQKYQQDLIDSANAGENYKTTVSELENGVKSAKQALETASEALAELKETAATDGLLVAPCDGTVTGLSYKAGETISQQLPVVATVSNASEATVSVSVAQDDIAEVDVDDVVNLSFDAYPDEKFTGEIEGISTSPARENSSTVSYTVTVKVGGDTAKLFDGMTASVTFITKELKDVLYVSNRAITTENGASTVKVKAADGSTEQRTVVTGFSDGRNVEIQEGLSEGETVLIESKVSAG